MKITNEEIAYSGYFKIKKYLVEDEKGHAFHKECFERGNSVAVLLYKPSTNTYLLTDQFRIGSKNHILEILAGSMDVNGESPLDTIKRESIEESGYKIIEGSEKFIAQLYVSPGGTSEKIFIYYAEVENKISEGGGIEDENIKIIEFTPQEIFDLINTNQIQDMKTYVALIKHFYQPSLK